MSTIIKDAGKFSGTITGAKFGLSKNGFPQVFLSLHADHDNDSDTGIDADISSYLILFNNADEYTEATANFNFTNLRKAVPGWAFAQFKDDDETLVGQPIEFSTKVREWNGKQQVEVSLGSGGPKPLDKAQLQAIQAKLQIGLGGGSPQRKAPAAASAAKPSPKSTSATTATTAPSATPTSKPTSAKPPVRVASPPTAPAESEDDRNSRLYNEAVAKYGEASVTPLWASSKQTTAQGTFDEVTAVLAVR